MFVSSDQFRKLLTAFIAISALLFVTYLLFGFFSSNDLEAYAQKAIDACADASYKPSCYDEEIPKFMDELSMEETFAVTRLVQEKSDGYWYCHVLGHNISAREAAKDPDSWTSVISRCPQGMCSNGCLHGTFQERFREEVLSDEQIEDLIPEIRTICEDSDDKVFTGLEKASCYHALGHLTMYITGADIKKSTLICDAVSLRGRSDHRQVCYDGVYMQIFQPLEPEDIALVQDIAPNTQEESVSLCNEYEGKMRASCLSESWPLYKDEIKEAEGIKKLCSLQVGEANQFRCYNALFYVVTPQLDFNVEDITALCNGFSGSRKAQCFGNAASRMIETDYRLQNDAVKLCLRAQEEGHGDGCFKELLLYSTFNFIPDSDAFNRFCAALPEQWGRRCENKEGFQVELQGNY